MEKGFLYIGKHETLNLFTGLFREITPWKFWNVYQAKRLSEQSVKGQGDPLHSLHSLFLPGKEERAGSEEVHLFHRCGFL